MSSTDEIRKHLHIQAAPARVWSAISETSS